MDRLDQVMLWMANHSEHGELNVERLPEENAYQITCTCATGLRVVSVNRDGDQIDTGEKSTLSIRK